MAKVIRNIKRALALAPNQQINYIVSGRIENFRPYRSFNFIDLNDGSTCDHLQVIMKRDILKKPELGSYITCQGNLQSSKGNQQSIEFKAEKIHYLGSCDPVNYPLAIGSTLSNDWYRKIIHLRPRAPHFASLLRVKSELELGLHMIMKQMDFFRVHTPCLTSNDSEASSDLFLVKRTKESDDQKGKRIIRDDYFNKDVFLTTSAQLHLENLAASLSRVYTLNPAFRPENSISTRHLCEFMMFEAEEANLTKLEPLMARVETIIKFAAGYLSEISEHSRDFNQLLETNSNHAIYQKMASSNYVRLHYKAALEILKQNFIGRAEEKKLLEHYDNVPIFITNFPKNLKPFYMKSEGDEAECFDLIAPFGGEICGGSLREDDTDKLLASLGKEHPESFDWYLDTRLFGTFPHGGFGIGFERLLQSLLGIRNIKDTLAFPRWTGHCPM